MQIVESFDEEQAVRFCLYCGIKNVFLEDGNLRCTQCPHFEGCWTDDGIEYDKNGIIEKFYDSNMMINSSSRKLTKNILKKQLDESYVVFSFGGMGPTGYYLYHFVQEENEDE